MRLAFYFTLLLLLIFSDLRAQNIDLYQIIDKVSSERIETDIKKLVSFGTRHSLSDTLSDTRGIGAARRWIKSEFENISKSCDKCLEVYYNKSLATRENSERVIKPTWIYNVVAIQRGIKYPNRYVIMSGDIDSRISDPNNYIDDSPGANDNASGMAGTIEAARVLSKYKFDNSIIYVGLSGEEQGLLGGISLAKNAKDNNWDIIGVLNNDMIGNIEGIDGVIDNMSFRIFSEPVSVRETEKERKRRRSQGGEIDGISRQLARYVNKTVKKFMPELNPILIYRLDRFGRGGHHKPFNDEGYAAIRIMEAHENYNRQHNDIRIENGIEYGDVLSGVNFDYAKKLTAVNAISLASLASSPPEINSLSIGGIVEPNVKFRWNRIKDPSILGYKIYWRETTSPTWDNSKFIGDIGEYELEGIVIDNFLFGISTVGKNGFESKVVFPNKTFRD